MLEKETQRNIKAQMRKLGKWLSHLPPSRMICAVVFPDMNQ